MMTRRGDVFWDPSGPEFEPETEEDKAARMRRLHNAFAEDMEMLFGAFDRKLELPRMKQ